jgi:protein-tyrosine phosphatase
MIDIHCHLLPGVDDGPADLNESIAMARMAAADGITTMIATPHQRAGEWLNDDPSRLRALLDEVRDGLGEKPALSLGAEIRVDSDLLTDIEKQSDGPLLSLAGSRYLLLEFDPLGFCPEPRDIVHELALMRWRPVIAHAERVPWLAEKPELLVELVELGAFIQITAGSVVGELGRGPLQCCSFLLDNDMAHFVASDAHDSQRRPPVLSSASRWIGRKWGEDVAHRLTVTNPQAVLDDRSLAAAPDRLKVVS